MSDNLTAAVAEFCGFASCNLDADGEPNVGVRFTIEADSAWIGWDDTVALHRWLSELLEVSREQR